MEGWSEAQCGASGGGRVSTGLHFVDNKCKISLMENTDTGPATTIAVGDKTYLAVDVMGLAKARLTQMPVVLRVPAASA